MWMHHNGKDLILGLIILIVNIWPTLLGQTVSMIVITVAAALLVIHGLFCMHGMKGERPSRRR